MGAVYEGTHVSLKVVFSERQVGEVWLPFQDNHAVHPHTTFSVNVPHTKRNPRAALYHAATPVAYYHCGLFT